MSDSHEWYSRGSESKLSLLALVGSISCELIKIEEQSDSRSVKGICEVHSMPNSVNRRSIPNTLKLRPCSEEILPKMR